MSRMSRMSKMSEMSEMSKSLSTRTRVRVLLGGAAVIC